jgi:predicted nucleotidyltransferase
MRRLWAAAYEAIARAVAVYLCAAVPASTAYLRGGMASGDLVYGLSDIDLLVVTPSDVDRPGARRRITRARWQSVRRRCLWLGGLVEVSVYEDADLSDALASCARRYGLPSDPREIGRAVYYGPGADRDEAGLLERPPLGGAIRDWRRIIGPDRRVSRPDLDRQKRRLVAWAHLQRWWAYAAKLCANPDQPGASLYCFKFIAEGARAWLWVAHDELPAARTAALTRAGVLCPEEGEAVTTALELRRRLYRPPGTALAVALGALMRFTARVADQLVAESEDSAALTLALDWGGSHELVMPHGGPMILAARADIGILPLADWRAVVLAPANPDETFSVVPGDPADPSVLGIAAQSTGTYATFCKGNVMVLPASDLWGRGMGRSVQCPCTDPVSFALARGDSRARVPELPGWSILDTARRAVAEHRPILAEDPAQSRDPVRTLALLFSAARAGLLFETLTADEPELPLTVSATSRALAARSPTRRGAIEEAEHSYRIAHTHRALVRPAVLGALRDAVLELRVYRSLFEHFPGAVTR